MVYNLLCTGALGFIGAHFVNHIFQNPAYDRIVILDKMSYCSSVNNICEDIRESGSDRVEIVVGDIQNCELVNYILEKYAINIVVHFAAESHVDNSFFNSLAFTMNNVYGTHCLLECCKLYNDRTGNITRFIHVSTDEVYGENRSESIDVETSVLNPTNPYAASKAAAEAYVKAYYHSYKFPVIITRGNNVYGEQQYPEKVIPRFICLLLGGKKLTVQGTGECQRSFIHVDDVVRAFEVILERGVIGEIYNIGSHRNEYSVKELAYMLLDAFGVIPEKYGEWIEWVEDRHFNDYRYFIGNAKLEALGWQETKTDFVANLLEMIEWYYMHRTQYKL